MFWLRCSMFSDNTFQWIIQVVSIYRHCYCVPDMYLNKLKHYNVTYVYLYICRFYNILYNLKSIQLLKMIKVRKQKTMLDQMLMTIRENISSNTANHSKKEYQMNLLKQVIILILFICSTCISCRFL